MCNRTATAAVLILLHAPLHGQINTFPYIESFDILVPPALPAGWTSTRSRTAGTNDFTSTSSTPNSPPNALISTNATIGQSLLSPPFSFLDRMPDSLSFFIRRSSSHQSGLIVEASLDGGQSFPSIPGDTLYYPGSTDFEMNAIHLPEVFSDHAEVMFRWRVIPGPSGATGTLRIDDVVVTARERFDLALNSVFLAPPFPAPEDTLMLTLGVQNVGTESVAGFQASLFIDMNGDSIAQASELKAAGQTTDVVLPGSTSDLTFSVGPLKAGTSVLIAAISSPGDLNPWNDSLVTVIHVGVPGASMVINEIMYAPTGSEPEWIELLNMATDTIDLKDWQITDNASEPVALSATSVPVPPDSFVVATDDLEGLLGAHPVIPAPVLSLTSLPALNNGGDAVVLFNNKGLKIDSVAYEPEWGGSGGSSLERIDPQVPGTVQANWRSSLDTSGSTPGRENSIVVLDDDLTVTGLPEMTGAPSSPIEVAIPVLNSGRNIAAGFSVSLYHDVDGDSLPRAPELIGNALVTDSLSSMDSTVVFLTWPNPPSGVHDVLVELEYEPDQRLRDNRAFGIVRIGYGPGTLIVNEIMYEPFSGNAEYIELYHAGELTLELDGWILSDRPGSDGEGNEITIDGARDISPGELFVLASDSSVIFLMEHPENIDSTLVLISPSGLSLNNTGDDVVLRDPSGSVVDSVSYLPDWHLPGVTDATGRSLEKIHPMLEGASSRSWSTCADPDGGTPGQPNSIRTDVRPKSSTLSFFPNPFSPDADGHQDYSIIHYNLATDLAFISLRIYDVKGRPVRTLATREVSGVNGDVVWDGYNDDGQRARVGMYIVFLEVISEDGVSLGSTKGVIVVAARL